jgi:hypothetical protein
MTQVTRFPSGASKTISEPMVSLAQNMHLSCIDTNTIFKRTEMSFHMMGVPSGSSKTISKPSVHSVQTVRLSCGKISTISITNRNEIPCDPYHLGVPSGAFKIIYEPMVCSVQTLHRSCVKISTLNGLKWASSRAWSPWSTIGWIQNDLWAYGTFGADRAPILHWH